MEKLTFKKELEILINKYGLDADTETPDFVLANVACDALASYAGAIQARKEYKKIFPGKTIEVREVAPQIPKEILKVADAVAKALGENCTVEIIGMKPMQSEVKPKRKRKRNKSKNNG